jgi:hypothetical protein
MVMPPGPILIFDKSALQALSVDEANWLDNFYMTNITPLFFAETLADLEKEIRDGRTPEQVVGNLALKTPDMSATACAHHSKIMSGVLVGREMPMDGRIPRDFGQVVNLDGKTGIFYARSQEEEALERWYRGEFLDVERQIAKQWRRGLSAVNYDELYSFFQKWFHIGKPKTEAEVKRLAEAYIDGSPTAASLIFGMTMLGVMEEAQKIVMKRWVEAGKPPISVFAPYFRHIYLVDLFFNLAIGADIISRERPSNKIDLAYLYYLPFCQIFTSRDKLHRRTVPLFLRDDQSFVDGDELKADLAKLDAHYSALPDEVKTSGFHKFAAHPPFDDSLLVTRLWDTHLPGWREIAANAKPPDQGEHKKLIEELNRIEQAAKTSDPRAEISIEETQFMQIIRTPRRAKGKWVRYPPNV